MMVKSPQDAASGSDHALVPRDQPFCIEEVFMG